MTKYIFSLLFAIQGVLVLAQSSFTAVPTDNKLAQDLDKVVHHAVEKFWSEPSRVGLSIGIYVRGKQFFYNYGSADKAKQRLPTSNTIYEIGSISKTFTGTLLAQAVRERKVKMEDDVRLYLDGQYPNLAYQGRPIQLAHLVSHISGLPAFLPDDPKLFDQPDFDVLPFKISKIQNSYSKAKFMADLHQVKLDTIPGYRFHYSNSGAQLLKYILEKLYHQSYDQLLKALITKPLKMSNTQSIYAKNNLNRLAKGHNGNGKLMPYNPQMLDAAGGIFSTTADMLRYLRFHLNEKNEVVALSHKETRGDLDDYAIGLNWQEQIVSKKYKKIWQSGGTFGFGSYGVAYPDRDIAIVLLSNESDQTTQDGLGVLADQIFEQLELER